MKVFKETTPWDFLFKDSWECYALKESLNHALHDKKSVEQSFNAYVEEAFSNQQCTNQTQLNDFMRFYPDEILKAIGLEEYI